MVKASYAGHSTLICEPIALDESCIEDDSQNEVINYEANINKDPLTREAESHIKPPCCCKRSSSSRWAGETSTRGVKQTEETSECCMITVVWMQPRGLLTTSKWSSRRISIGKEEEEKEGRGDGGRAHIPRYTWEGRLGGLPTSAFQKRASVSTSATQSGSYGCPWLA